MSGVSRRLRPLAAALACAAVGALGCGDGGGAGPAPIAVLSAFPAEMAAVLERMEIVGTRGVQGHTFRVGRLGGRLVVVGMTGIGLVNAAEVTRILLDAFAVRGVVVSGVAGSPLLVGDVTAAASWAFEGDDARFAATPDWLERAAAAAAAGAIALEDCAIVPAGAPFAAPRPGDRVCLPTRPRVVVGGIGESGDPYGDRPFACIPGSGDVFDCDGAEPRPFASDGAGGARPAALVRAADDGRVAIDMETAAIAREATARGLPFIAFRAVSDGVGDPLGLAGPYEQFFAYYRLASRNAAAATEAFLAGFGPSGATAEDPA